MYDDLLEAPIPSGITDKVTFTAGSAGAGKSRGIASLPKNIQPAILDKFIPDADTKNKLAHEIATLTEKQAHEIAIAQIAVNKEDIAMQGVEEMGGGTGTQLAVGLPTALIAPCLIRVVNLEQYQR